MGEVKVSNKIRVKNLAELIDICNDLSHFVDSDDSQLTDMQYDKLSDISDHLNEWQPDLEVTSKYTAKEAEL